MRGAISRKDTQPNLATVKITLKLGQGSDHIITVLVYTNDKSSIIYTGHANYSSFCSWLDSMDAQQGYDRTEYCYSIVVRDMN